MQNDYQYNAICDSCGQKKKSTQLRARWDGMMVCYDTCWEARHPMDFYRTRNDTHKLPWTRPEATDTFLRNPGYAVKSDGGAATYISVASPAASQVPTTLPITLEAMVYLRSYTGSIMSITRYATGGWLLRLSALGEISALFYDSVSNDRYAIGTTAVCPLNKWVRLSATILTSTSARASFNYLDSNGTLVTVDETPSVTISAGGYAAPVAPIYMVGDAFSEPFPGQVDDIRVWDVARTTAQYTANWNKLVPLDTDGLISNWRFDVPYAAGLVPATTTDDSILTQTGTFVGGLVYVPHMT